MPIPISKTCGTATNGSTWSNVTFAQGAADAQYTSEIIPADNNGRNLDMTNFGFAIPAGASIVGIIAEIRKYCISSIHDNNIQLIINGVATGNNKQSGVSWGTTPRNDSYGGVSDLWGTTPTVAQINASNFGVRLSGYNVAVGTANTGFVDCITVTVYYGVPVVTSTMDIDYVDTYEAQ